MHESSMKHMSDFVNENLNKDMPLCILDIGASDIHGAYRPLFNSNPLWKYTGLDIVAGANVDIVASHEHHYPVGDSSFDVVVSGQVLEHVEDIYAFADEIYRIVKPGGMVCIIAPCVWNEHKFPHDCWRFYPDGLRFLFVKKAKFKEVKIFYIWNGPDCVAILKKPE